MTIFAKYTLDNIPRAPDERGGAPAAPAAPAAPVAPAAAAPAAPATPAAPAAPAAGWYADANYKLSDPVKQWAEGHKFPDPDKALEYGMNAEKIARDRNAITAPDPKDPQKWDGYEKLGWVPDATKYTVEKPAVKQGELLHEGMFGEFTKLAHAAKLAPWQAKAVFDGIFAFGNTEVANADALTATERKNEVAALDKTLHEKWPGAMYNEKRTLAGRAMKFAKLDANDSKLLEQALGAPGLVEFFANYGEAMGEDKMPLDGGGGGFGGDSAATLETQLNRFETDAGNITIMNDERHPRHNEIVAARRELIRKLSVAQTRGSKAA